ncbi:MAG: ABC-F family ATP-binding cassette domain-containing protein [Bacteroidia bacterium]|nr:ABC-F family ATP-binding cassette domain-containing protein [Bacteroidia bacterium]
MITYLQVENLSKYWGELALFDGISFSIFEGQKVAIIAKNGAGKSTLMDIIAGLETPDSGKSTLSNHISIGYLRQNPDLNPEDTVLEAAFNSTGELIQTVKNYEKALENHDPKLLDSAMERMNALNAWDFELRIKQILTQLKITDVNQQIKFLSGGQKKRVALAHILIDEPDFLILDEPTNHLDLEMIEWLEKYLEKAKGTLFMVTHDRYFLDRVCNEIIELEDNTIYKYKGNYSYYVEKREERIQSMNAEIDRARNLFRTELEWLRRMPQARSHKSKYRTENAYKLQEKASQRRVEDEVELTVQGKRLGSKILNVKNLSKAFDELIILDKFSYNFARLEKIGIIGKNGSGKTTVLNMLTGALQPDSGTIDVGETISFGYYRQDGISFNQGDRVIDVIKEIAEVVDMGNGNRMTASQFLNYFLFPPESQYNFVEKLSGGEKRRLYLCTILMRNPNFLILDEPTNDLDIMTLNVFEDYLRNFQGCAIVVSHDRFFMDKIVDHLFVFEGEGKIKDFPGNYSDYRNWVEEKEKEQRSPEKREKITKPKPAKEGVRKLSFNEKRELEQLEKDITMLEEEKKVIEAAMNSGDCASEELVIKSQRHGEIMELLDEKELRWLELSELE